jgi:hypothetical protein
VLGTSTELERAGRLYFELMQALGSKDRVPVKRLHRDRLAIGLDRFVSATIGAPQPVEAARLVHRDRCEPGVLREKAGGTAVAAGLDRTKAELPKR